MPNIRLRINLHKRAKEKILSLVSNPDNVLVIHYSCESFYNTKEGKTPRITSIAVRFLKNGQTKSFSIHKIAERENVDFREIEKHYDELEKKMLDEFFEFVTELKND